MKMIMNKLSQAALTAGTVLFVTVAPALAQVPQSQTVTINPPSSGITNLTNLLSAGINVAIMVAAVLTFVFLIWGGIQWITSGGDKAAYEAARNRITAALIGLAIVAAAWGIMLLVGTFFNVDINHIKIPNGQTGQ